VLGDDFDASWMGIDECWIAPTSDEQLGQLSDGEPVSDIDSPHFSLQDLLDWAIDAGYFDEKASDFQR
jgi:hypothetical protein